MSPELWRRMTGYPPSLIRSKRRLVKDPVFDPTAPMPLTIFKLGAEKKEAARFRNR
jgi:hypothetical protein